MTKQKETPEERKARLTEQLKKANAVKKAKMEQQAAQKEAGTYVPKPKRPKNLDKIVREILNDEEIVDLVVSNQPEWWEKLKTKGIPKNPGYIISTVQTIKAMGGDAKAADWIRKTGWGDKVMLESEDGFFQKSEFTIQVVPPKHLEESINAQEVIEGEIKQIEE